MTPVLNELRVGNRVWSMGGYPDHGPMEGPKVSIPADTGGTVVDTEKPYRTMDQLLYVVRWDTGQTSKHYFKQLFGIGQYATVADFHRAIETASGKAEVVLGPQGGFREARVELMLGNGSAARIELYEGQGHFWDHVKPMLAKSAVAVAETRLKAKMPARRSKDAG
ncbi:MAG: hypothetical protein HYY18_03330 [Planctomycetes bacterium]|nr:hypothetical protein [Planctomycetota bacterium]